MLTWQIFKNYLLSQRAGSLVRTIARLCILGVTVGVAALVIVLSVMNGFQGSIRDKMLAAEPHLLVYATGENQEAIAEFLKGERAEVSGFETQDVILRTVEGLFSGAIAQGANPDSLNTMLERISVVMKTRKNNLAPEALAVDLEPGEVIIGIDLARTLNILEGDQVVVIPPEMLLLPSGEAPIYERLTVKSLLSTQVPDIDSKYLYYELGESLLSFKKVSSLERGLEVRLKNPDLASDVKKTLTSLYPDVRVQTWEERNGSLFFALKMEKIAMTVLLSLTVLITSFSIITVLYMLMTQKRQDIGVLMALGLSPRRTRNLFVQVGLILSGLGILVGSLIGLSVALFLEWYPLDLLPDVYVDSSIPAQLEGRTILLVVSIALVMAFLGAWIPAQANVKGTPSESLRQ